MVSYKKLWMKLKENVTDQKVLELMNTYEETNSVKKCKKYKTKRSLMSKPWYNTYKMTRQLLSSKVYRKVISKQVYIQLKEDFNRHVNGLMFGEITNEELQRWLENKHKEYVYESYYNNKKSKIIKKPKLTHSGFERRAKSKMSLSERATIVIDELVYKFVPRADNKYNLKLEYYEEDWRQELWVWCWEIYKGNRDINLSQLIINYNNLGHGNYIFYINNFFSRMNRHVISYVAKLQYSCNEISKYDMSDKYRIDELYPADDLSTIENVEVEDLLDTKIIANVDGCTLFNQIIDYFHNKYKTDGNVSWLRYIELLKMRYGFNEDGKVYTFLEISKQFNISRQRVHQLEVKMLNIIKRYLRIKL